jgi:bifunctional UDP-N-acetylglucosamine pyrophosphorylase/glucosamine-1-phosphate N-acetyltransferase
LKDRAEHLLVLPSDHPFVEGNTIKKLAEQQIKNSEKITVATIQLPDFKDWRSAFYKSFSIIVRDDKGEIVRDIQFKDATEEEKKITEVNTIYFCFDVKWLGENLSKLGNDNTQQEYYITDLLRLAYKQGEKIGSIQIDPHEALGANSKEELEVLEKLMIK